jgi:hypothetical protein
VTRGAAANERSIRWPGTATAGQATVRWNAPNRLYFVAFCLLVGARPACVRRLSWTLDEDVDADSTMAYRTIPVPDPVVAMAQIVCVDVLSFVNDRGEQGSLGRRQLMTR